MRGSSDFEFWVEKSPEDHPYYDNSGDTEDHFLACSPPLWTRTSKSFQHETYPLLPSNHHYSCSSPTSRLRAIANGRRELMEMIKDIPESSYELSLKDIVEDKHSKEKEKTGTIEEEMNSNKTETRNSRKSKTAGRSQISRTQSMDSGVFLLKMSLPIPVFSKKNSKVRNCTKISPGPSSEGSEKRTNKDWWKMIFSSVKDRNRKCINIRRSSSDKTSSKTSTAESNIMPRQLSLNSKKYKPSGQGRCLF
ncbi:Hypothetical predicted protein [Olea europaea subsp. europaea]|uniref:Uncharacterized protein n=1 Tax=Olea europaea subsp. europaea TaxID=158383 RepID=A0A8S0V2F8_OLEEU|nr:Hypothetical predicted protein [Olea europaea subsp. europaea]